jgi:hypothetical protein
MRTAAFVEFGCIGLYPAPDTAGIHLHTPFGDQFRDVHVRERIPEIPAHAQNDHFSRKLAPFERIVRVDRHGLLPYQNPGSEVRNGTVQSTIEEGNKSVNKFRFTIPSTLPTEAIVGDRDSNAHQWLIWWSARYRHEEGDDPTYVDLIDKHKSLSAEHFREIGKWMPSVASDACLIWEQAAEELPSCPERPEAAEFLMDWSCRTYTDLFANRPVTKRFGLSRATTLLHFVSGGSYPIFDSRVTTAIASLLERPELSDCLESYMDFCLPLVDELVQCCEAENVRMLHEALFSYGRLKSAAKRASKQTN